VIEIDNLKKACGLSVFRYRTFPSPRLDNVPASLISAQAEPTPGPATPEPPLAMPAADLSAPGLQPTTPASHSVLQEVAAALDPIPAAPRSARPSRAARSAWQAATSPAHQPR
jgi:hypothetical protein